MRQTQHSFAHKGGIEICVEFVAFGGRACLLCVRAPRCSRSRAALHASGFLARPSSPLLRVCVFISNEDYIRGGEKRLRLDCFRRWISTATAINGFLGKSGDLHAGLFGPSLWNRIPLLVLESGAGSGCDRGWRCFGGVFVPIWRRSSPAEELIWHARRGDGPTCVDCDAYFAVICSLSFCARLEHRVCDDTCCDLSPLIASWFSGALPTQGSSPFPPEKCQSGRENRAEQMRRVSELRSGRWVAVSGFVKDSLQEVRPHTRCPHEEGFRTPGYISQEFPDGVQRTALFARRGAQTLLTISPSHAIQLTAPPLLLPLFCPPRPAPPFPLPSFLLRSLPCTLSNLSPPVSLFVSRGTPSPPSTSRGV